MTSAGAFREEYEDALQGFLLAGGEGQLRIAYELGRRAVAQEVSVLDLADAHHEALLAALTTPGGTGRTRQIVGAAGDFLREALSAFEMVQRGFRDARDGAANERHRSAMLRQLSDLLADGSLELDATESLEEMALLLAEQTRELCGGDACLVTFAGGVSAVSCDEEEPGWLALPADPAVRRLVDLVPSSGRSLRLDARGLSRHGAGAQAALASLPGPLRGWLAAPLTTLGGDRLGAIQLFSSSDHVLGERDEQMAVHLAQMASAALERRGWPTAIG
jgi:GAF domain-containing protein